ncbi:MAG: hypothetical protein ACI4E1_04670 [Lachnospira sp.]
MKRQHFALRRAKRTNEVIGLIGICPGAGTTHLGIMLANYYANGLHKKVAVVGIGPAQDYDLIREELDTKRVRYYKGSFGRHAFSYKGIDFFARVHDGMIGILRDFYDIIIVDLSLDGVDSNMLAALREVTECEKKILVGSFSPWKCKECVKKIERINRILKVDGLTLATMTTSPKRVKEIEKNYNIRVCQVPMETNPFKICGEHLGFIKNLGTY